MEQDTHSLIREMNLSYLLLIRRLLVEDKASGMSSLGVSSELAHVLVALSRKEIASLASVPQMLCSFRFHDRRVLSALTQSQVELSAMALSPLCMPAGEFT